MNKYGETYGFKASDFTGIMEKYLGKNTIDYCVVNTQPPESKLLERYEKVKNEPVEYDAENFLGKQVKVLTGKFLRKGQFLRHDPEKLAEVLAKIIDEKKD